MYLSQFHRFFYSWSTSWQAPKTALKPTNQTSKASPAGSSFIFGLISHRETGTSSHQIRRSSKEKLLPPLLFQTLGQAAQRNQIDRSAIPLSHTHLHLLLPPDHFLAFVRPSCPFLALYPVTLVNCKVLFGSLLSKNRPLRGCPSVTGTIKGFFLHPCSPPPFFIFISKHISKISCLFASAPGVHRAEWVQVGVSSVGPPINRLQSICTQNSKALGKIASPNQITRQRRHFRWTCCTGYFKEKGAVKSCLKDKMMKN